MEKSIVNPQSIAKSLAIIGVLGVHAVLFTNPTRVFQFSFLYAIAPYLMAMFFFYAGYNYKPNTGAYKEKVKHRAKQLLIPLVAIVLLGILVVGGMELATGVSIEAIATSLIRVALTSGIYSHFNPPFGAASWDANYSFFTLYSIGVIWFLYTLFLVSLVFYLVVDYTNKKLSRLLSVVVLCLVLAFVAGQFWGQSTPYSIGLYPLVLAIMLVGAYLKQSSFLDPDVKTKKELAFTIINAVIAEILVVLTVLLCHFQFGSYIVGSMSSGSLVGDIGGFDALITFAFSIIGTYAVHQLARAISLIPYVRNVLNFIGLRSGIFYAGHVIIYCLLQKLVFRGVIWPFALQALTYVIIALLLIAGIRILYELIMKRIKAKKAEAPKGESA